MSESDKDAKTLEAKDRECCRPCCTRTRWGRLFQRQHEEQKRSALSCVRPS